MAATFCRLLPGSPTRSKRPTCTKQKSGKPSEGWVFETRNLVVGQALLRHKSQITTAVFYKKAITPGVFKSGMKLPEAAANSNADVEVAMILLSMAVKASSHSEHSTVDVFGNVTKPFVYNVAA